LARESDCENKKRDAQRCGHRHYEDHVATASHAESFALPPNGPKLSGERPPAGRTRVRCSALFGVAFIEEP